MTEQSHEDHLEDVEPDVEADVEVGVEPDLEPEPDLESGVDLPTRTGHPTSTGHPAVDEVLRSLEGLDGRPVDEHVAAFEQAHDQLRRALSSAGDDQD